MFGKSLSMVDLQFSYQKDCNVHIASSRKRSTSYETAMKFLAASFMDMKKAFDMVKHSLLFQKLINKDLSCIFVCLQMKMYTSQFAEVRWEQKISGTSNVTNSYKQGAVLIYFILYYSA